MMVGLQIFIEKEEMVLDSNFWCGCSGNIQNQCFFNKSLPDIATGEASFCICLFSSQG